VLTRSLRRSAAQRLDQIVDPHQLVEDVTIMIVRLRLFRRDDIEGEEREIEPPLSIGGRQPGQKVITLRGELQLLRGASAVAQKELDPDQHVDRLVQPDDDVIVALDAQRLEAMRRCCRKVTIENRSATSATSAAARSNCRLAGDRRVAAW